MKLHPDFVDFISALNTAKADYVIVGAYAIAFFDIKEDDILSGKIIQLGYPPVRIDLLSKLTGLTTAEIWRSRQRGKLGEHDVFFLGQDDYTIKNVEISRRFY